MLHELILMHQSSSSAGLVLVFTRFLQARMLPTETSIQYCSKISGLFMELGRFGQPISEPLLHLLVIHGLPPKFADFASQVSTGVIDVVHGFNSWDAFLLHLRDYTTHLNIHPAPITATSTNLDPSDLVYLGQPALDKNRDNHLITLFTCPMHRSNDHTLDRCGTVNRFFAPPRPTLHLVAQQAVAVVVAPVTPMDSNSNNDAAPLTLPNLPQDSRSKSARRPKPLSHP
jgi:hypothetical protein